MPVSTSASYFDADTLVSEGRKIGAIKAPRPRAAVAARVVLTGKLSTTRHEVTALLNALGYAVSNSVTRGTAFVLVPDHFAQKTDKIDHAYELGISVVAESDFVRWVETGENKPF